MLISIVTMSATPRHSRLRGCREILTLRKSSSPRRRGPSEQALIRRGISDRFLSTLLSVPLYVCLVSFYLPGCSKTDEPDGDAKKTPDTTQKPSVVPLDQTEDKDFLYHLQSPEDMHFLLLGENFRIDDVSKIPVCNATIPVKPFADDKAEAPSTIVVSARQHAGLHACPPARAKQVLSKLSPGACTVVIASLKIERSSKATFAKVPSRKRTKKERVDFELHLESPIAADKVTESDLAVSDWTAVSLCNRSDKPQPITIKSRCASTNGSTVTGGLISRVDFPIPEMSANKEYFLGNARKDRCITVRRIINDIIEKDTIYPQTDRDLRRILKLLPQKHVDLESLKHKTVLDAGCGEGSFVLDLRAHDIEAYGLDIKLNDKQRELSFFIEADMTDTKLKASRFDVIYSIFTIFSDFYEGKDASLVEKALVEFYRILKPGGEIILFSVNRNAVAKSLKAIPGLSITEYEENRSSPYSAQAYMVLKKQPTQSPVR